MRRDMDLIRLILLDAEGEGEIDLSPFTDEQIGYHRLLLLDARLAEGANITGMSDSHPQALSTGLTGKDMISWMLLETTLSGIKPRKPSGRMPGP